MMHSHSGTPHLYASTDGDKPYASVTAPTSAHLAVPVGGGKRLRSTLSAKGTHIDAWTDASNLWLTAPVKIVDFAILSFDYVPNITAATRGKLTVTLDDDGVRSTTPMTAKISCDSLTADKIPDRFSFSDDMNEAARLNIKYQTALPGVKSISLSAKRAGPVRVTITMHPDAVYPETVSVVDRRGDWSRIAIATVRALYFGWTPLAVEKQEGSIVTMGHGGGVGEPTPKGIIICDHALPLRVVADDGTTIVGQHDPRTELQVMTDTDDGVSYRLSWLAPTLGVRFTLTAAEIAGCARTTTN